MAGGGQWRSLLNKHPLCKLLREHNDKQPKKKSHNDSKSLIAIKDGDLFIWDSYTAGVISFNLRNLVASESEEPSRVFDSGDGSPTTERPSHVQTLLCTDAPLFDVDKIGFNQSGSHLILAGQKGVMVLELPQRWGKYSEFAGGKRTVSCRTTQIAERYLSGQGNVMILQADWHPGSDTDTHLLLLTSDNALSIYDLLEPDSPKRVIHLNENNDSYSAATSKLSLSFLGDGAVGFDVGLPIELPYATASRSESNRKQTVMSWPVYIVRGNGDVLVTYTDFSNRHRKSIVVGPLTMHPPADDNYGTDACSIACLPTVPQVIVIATCTGRLHHCILLNSQDDAYESDVSYRTGSSTSLAQSDPPELSLYVYESVELELSLATYSIETEEVLENEFSCPVKLMKDPSVSHRYHCSHAAGVHTVVLSWLQDYQKFCEEEIDEIPDNQECIVEHLICTKPLPSSPPSPVIGLSMVSDHCLGNTLLTLTSTIEFITLPLRSQYRCSSPTLLSTTSGKSIPSPLRRIHREPFYEFIRKILQRNSSNPLLRSGPSSELSQQECFQLLTRATQVFREEYIERHEQARGEIEKRVRLLDVQKRNQLEDIQTLSERRIVLRESAQSLAEKYEDSQDRQTGLLKRLEKVMRNIQSKLPVLSDSERAMQKELRTIDVKLEEFKKGLEQIKIKQQYQRRQMDQQPTTGAAGASPAIKVNQIQQLKDILKQEGDEIADLMKNVNLLKINGGV